MENNCLVIFSKSLDYFGTQINFRFDNNSQYQSVSGGIASFIFSIFSFAFTLYNFILFVGRENISVIYMTKIIPQIL